MKTPLISEPTGGQNQRRFLFCAFLCDFKAASFYRLWLTAFPEKIIEISAGAALLLSAKCNGIIFTLTLTSSKILELYSPRCITVQKTVSTCRKSAEMRGFLRLFYSASAGYCFSSLRGKLPKRAGLSNFLSARPDNFG